MNARSAHSPSLCFFVLARCFLRSYLVGANFNTRGMQNVGLALALEPGLRVLHSRDKSWQQARRRALQHYNTHPFWTPLLVGIFLALERDIARGILPPAALQRVKATTTYTLSALGDSFFGGGALVFFSLILALLVVNGWIAAAWGWVGTFFVLLQLFKVLTFVGGLREGIAYLNRLKRWNLINWAQRLKYANAALLLILWMGLWPALGPAWTWVFWSLGLVIGALCYLHFGLSRVWIVLGFVGYWAAMTLV